MAFYDIAAKQQRISPIKEMMQARSQMDAHKLNQQSIQKNEIQMPYVEQLTQQSVRKGELDIEDAETRMPHLRRQLEQQEELTDQQIDLTGEQVKAATRQRKHQEAISSGKYSDEELSELFPIRHMAYKAAQAAAQQDMSEQVKEQIALIRSANGSDPEAMASAYNELLGSEEAAELSKILPQATAENIEKILYGLEDAMDTGSKDTMSRLMDAYEKYKALGKDDLAAIALEAITNMGNRYRTSGTQLERTAQINFGEYPSPMAAQTKYDELKDLLKFEREKLIGGALARISPTGQLYGGTNMQELADENPEEYNRLVQDMTLATRAFGMLTPEEQAKYLELDAHIQKKITRPSGDATAAEATAGRDSQYKQTDTLHGKDYTVGEPYEIDGKNYIYRGGVDHSFDLVE